MNYGNFTSPYYFKKKMRVCLWEVAKVALVITT